MFNVLITGRLTKLPKSALGRNGQPFCTAYLRVPVQGQREEEPDFIYASVIAFGADAEKLSKLVQGDAVSLSGSARIIQWEKDGRVQCGINVTVTGLLSAYELRKRRGYATGYPEKSHHLSQPRKFQTGHDRPAIFASADDLDEDLEF